MQVGLSPAEWKDEVAGAFRPDVSSLLGKNFLLMDDVAKTGAILAACAAALLKAKAKAVQGLTLPKALAHHGLLVL